MRQRNTTGYPLNADPLGRVVAPGEEFTHESLIPGCEELTPAPDAEAAGGEPGAGGAGAGDGEAEDLSGGTPARATRKGATRA